MDFGIGFTIVPRYDDFSMYKHLSKEHLTQLSIWNHSVELSLKLKNRKDPFIFFLFWHPQKAVLKHSICCKNPAQEKCIEEISVKSQVGDLNPYPCLINIRYIIMITCYMAYYYHIVFPIENCASICLLL